MTLNNRRWGREPLYRGRPGKEIPAQQTRFRSADRSGNRKPNPPRRLQWRKQNPRRHRPAKRGAGGRRTCRRSRLRERSHRAIGERKLVNVVWIRGVKVSVRCCGCRLCERRGVHVATVIVGFHDEMVAAGGQSDKCVELVGVDGVRNNPV
jgi:hypothetical protein